jgi:hypothetical protein
VVTEDGKEVRRKILKGCLSARSSRIDDFDSHDRRREVYETPDQKLRLAIIKLGEVVSVQGCWLAVL